MAKLYVCEFYQTNEYLGGFMEVDDEGIPVFYNAKGEPPDLSYLETTAYAKNYGKIAEYKDDDELARNKAMLNYIGDLLIKRKFRIYV